MTTVIAALAATMLLTAMAVLGGFIAAMPDGTLAHGVTPRLRAELYLSSAGTLLLLGQVWLSLAPAR